MPLSWHRLRSRKVVRVYHLHDSNTMNMNVTVGCADLGAPY